MPSLVVWVSSGSCHVTWRMKALVLFFFVLSEMASQLPPSSDPTHSAELCSKQEPLRSLLGQISFPPFHAKQKRIDSFKNLKKLNPGIKIEVLADDGFFYLGKEDYIICFMCKLCLTEWMDEDDAAYEHARYDPVCSRLSLSRGEDFVREVRQCFKVTGQ